MPPRPLWISPCPPWAPLADALSPASSCAKAPRFVAVLDQQPCRLLVGFLALHADQRPAALHFRALQLEFQVPVAVALARIADRHPAALVPDDDLAGAVPALGYLAFELGVREGMIFHLHGHALDGGIVAGALGHRPALHRAVQLQPEVIMQPAGPVLLDDEGAGRFSRFLR
ncbi:hypothetical protein G6F68_012041 [Rhizopus microsporus]|nr:hypothetical protein G6F68_012041 [Rhizopus microsporus]